MLDLAPLTHIIAEHNSEYFSLSSDAMEDLAVCFVMFLDLGNH